VSSETAGVAEVQWYGSSGGGVRSYRLYGVTLVHLRITDERTTLCGRSVARRSKWTYPSADDRRCRICAKRAAALDNQ